MRRHNRKGAIELSMNFIVVIIISLVIVVGGLAMFFNLKKNAQAYVDAVDTQTEGRIKNMMLKGIDRAAVYPIDFEISANDAQLVGVGITNIYDGPNPALFKVIIDSVTLYNKANTNGAPAPGVITTYYDMTATPNGISIGPHDQKIKGILIKIPKGSVKGQYVYTIKVSVDDGTTNGYKEYSILQVFANVK